MSTKTALIAVLAASTFLTTGAAFAQDTSSQHSQASAPNAQQQTVEKDFGKLSKDGSLGFQDLALTRLAIFDGRIADAKKYVAEADSSFDKAKGDDTVFMKAEGDLKSPQDAQSGSDKGASGEKTGAMASSGQANEANGGASATDMKTPKAWLPVDGEISLIDNFSANPKKAAAVADANASLAKGDRKGALEKLKLADVDLDIVLAVVPVNQTITDVHQAAQLVDSGKYYEASQMLRKVQDSARFDVADIVGVPKKGMDAGQKAPAPKDGETGSATTH